MNHRAISVHRCSGTQIVPAVTPYGFSYHVNYDGQVSVCRRVPLVAGHGRITDPPNRAGGNYKVAGTICGQNMDGTMTRDA